jgi:hypothetical protein
LEQIAHENSSVRLTGFIVLLRSRITLLAASLENESIVGSINFLRLGWNLEIQVFFSETGKAILLLFEITKTTVSSNLIYYSLA